MLQFNIMLYECQSMLNRLLLISREVCLNLVLVNIRLLDYYQRREEGEEIQLEINSNINIRSSDHYLRREHALSSFTGIYIFFKGPSGDRGLVVT